MGDSYNHVVKIKNENRNNAVQADGLCIELDIVSRSSNTLDPRLSENGGNNRFIDFRYNDGGSDNEAGYIAIRGTGANFGERVGLQNKSDGRLKLNQRPIEYSLDDFSEIPLKSYEWQRPFAEYNFSGEYDISGSSINTSGSTYIVTKENLNLSELDNKYIFSNGYYLKVEAEFIGSGTTILNIESDTNISSFFRTNDVISAYTQTVTMKETGATGHGVVAQDLLELPKFSGITTDWESRNVAKGLKEGDLGYSYNTIDYVEFMPAIMAGLQDANKLIKELRQEVDDLKEQLKNK